MSKVRDNIQPLLTARQPAGASPGSPQLPAGQLPEAVSLTKYPSSNENAAANHASSRAVASALRLSAHLLLAITLTGCRSGDPVPTAYVEGAVMLDDAPLANAEVNFLGSGYAGITKTDAQGAFKLKAQVGKNIVYFSKYESEVDPTLTVGMEGKSAKFLPKQLVPKKYTTDKSEIKDDVPRGGQRGVEFRLKSP